MSFSPIGNTVLVSASNVTGNVALTSLGTYGASSVLRVYNDASTTAYVNIGTDNTVTAVAATSLPIPSKGVEYIPINEDITHAAAILASSTGNVHFTVGKQDNN